MQNPFTYNSTESHLDQVTNLSVVIRGSLDYHLASNINALHSEDSIPYSQLRSGYIKKTLVELSKVIEEDCLSSFHLRIRSRFEKLFCRLWSEAVAGGWEEKDALEILSAITVSELTNWNDWLLKHVEQDGQRKSK